jgi:hypothetical protein
MAKPVVIVVGADKGGVGKTTVSRTLLDYFDANSIPTRAFDTESPRGTLKRFHPDITEIVDMTTTSDQMKIFDTLNAAAPRVTVIDVRAGLMSPALASLRDIGFLDAAKSGQITFAVFHVLGPSIASLDEIAETTNFMQGAKYFLVKNFINDTNFFEWDKATYNFYFRKLQDAIELSILNSTKWRLSRSKLLRCRSSNSLPTKAWMINPQTIHLCYAAMSTIG